MLHIFLTHGRSKTCANILEILSENIQRCGSCISYYSINVFRSDIENVAENDPRT